MRFDLASEIEWNLPHGNLDLLPMITALFKDGRQPDFDWLQDPQAKKKSGSVPVSGKSVIPLPWLSSKRVLPDGRSPLPMGIIDMMEKRSLAVPGRASQYLAVRNFIRGVSHHFNNLLMGIWGHASLMRMRAKPGSRIYNEAIQMEKLIQSGSFLIHVILGYMGERRKAAKSIRLNQLIKEVQGLTQVGDPVFDILGLDTLMHWVSQANHPQSIALSIAWVIERLLSKIKIYRSAILNAAHNNRTLRKQLATIAVLVERGLMITRKLRMCNGDIRSRKRCINIEKIVRNQVRRTRRQNKHLCVSCRVTTPKIYVCAERDQIEFVLQQLVDNAVQAMPQGGDLEISLSTLYAEAPKNRCAVHPGSDYAVVSVKDNGQGIDKKTQAHIFEPFFSTADSHDAVGLGLSAASGITRSYGGYIYVKSAPEAGSIFKIYWPLSRKQTRQKAHIARPAAVPA